jgi:hypothetical protein
MCPREAMPEPWRSFLNELDRVVTSTVRLDCIGGFVVTMLYGLSRPTANVDVLEIAPRAAADAFSQVAMLGGPFIPEIWRLFGSSDCCAATLRIRKSPSGDVSWSVSKLTPDGT